MWLVLCDWLAPDEFEDVSHRPQILGQSQTDNEVLFAGSSAVPHLPSFRSIFSQPDLNFHHPSTVMAGGYTSSDTEGIHRRPENRAIEYFSNDFAASNSHNSHPLPADFGQEIINQPIFPRDGLTPEPQTSINGGTFISGNVNYIQRQGESGKLELASVVGLLNIP
jgi:hypothetical protein